MPFAPAQTDANYLTWPLLTDLFPVSFPGVKTSRDDLVVDIDKDRLVSRMEQYFDSELSDAEIKAILPTAMTNAAGFDARKTRRYLAQPATAPNLSKVLGTYLDYLKIDPLDFFMHCAAVLHAPSYRRENAGALRIDWPRIPLPIASKALLHSAELGGAISGLLDLEVSVKGTFARSIRLELGGIGPISREGGGALNPDAGDLNVTAGWGHGGKGDAVMPGKGKAVHRGYSAKECEALVVGAKELGLSKEQVFSLLGDGTLDVYLNDRAYWRNIPIQVWDYTIGGYQVIKKWLSYREHPILGRGLTMEEVRTVTEIARRIAAIILMGPALDANYETVKSSTYLWRRDSPEAE